MVGNRCPGLVAEALGPELRTSSLHPPRGCSCGCCPTPSRPGDSPGVPGEVPMFGRVAQNSGGCSGVGDLSGVSVSFWGAGEQGGRRKPKGCE